MLILAIETSCDETSVALVRQGAILCNLVASQTQLHAEYGGVVPELATREHHRNLLPLARQALDQTELAIDSVDAVAATQGPGLPPALMIGFYAAQALAWALDRPFVPIHHHEAHLYSPWATGRPPAADWASLVPNVSLIVSGGHTLLVHVRAPLEHSVLGSTLDDAAGECFDKTAKLLGLSYPGGPEIDRLSAEGQPIYAFPRPMIHDPTDDFSFSGLKTAVRYFVQKNPELLARGQAIRDLAASVQAAIVEVLETKLMRAAERLGVDCVTASGGVSVNRGLRAALTRAAQRRGLQLRLAEGSLCTDNAGMIGLLAERKLDQGTFGGETLAADISPSKSLAGSG